MAAKYRALVAGLLLSSHAFGCDCPSSGECAEVLPGDSVYLAIVTDPGSSSLQQLWADFKALLGGSGQRIAQLQVLETLRGEHQATRLVLTAWDDCGTLSEAGQRYLVYAHRDEATGLDETSTCQGTRRLGQQPDPMLEYLRASRRDPSLGLVFGKVLALLQRAVLDPPPPVTISLLAPNRQYTVTPDASGRFSFPPVPAGRYTLSADAVETSFNGAPKRLDVPRGCLETNLMRMRLPKANLKVATPVWDSQRPANKDGRGFHRPSECAINPAGCVFGPPKP